MKESQTEILLNIDRKPEAGAFMDFLDSLPQSEKKDILVFLQGVKFAKTMDRGAQAGA